MKQLFNVFECKPPCKRKTIFQHSILVTKANKYKVKSWPVLAFCVAATELMQSVPRRGQYVCLHDSTVTH